MKRAAGPLPLAEPETPAVPATVDTTPAGVTLRTVSLLVSATYTFPLASTPMPDGWLNWAAAPVPSAWPVMWGVPAIVVTTPAGVTFLIVLRKESAT